MIFSRISTAVVLALGLAAPVLAAPSPRQEATGWWFANVERQGVAAFNEDPNYKVFRNVHDYGAVGDGTTDDTDAINKAISDGNRCGEGCSSQTTTPAIVYFPPGKYLVSKPIIPYYYTQLVGDAVSLPTIVASASFEGMAVIDADPYDSEGNNWWTNQNNFFRQIRNFIISLEDMPISAGAGIHWQVAQATSLQNIVFNMRKGGGEENKQQGIFMDNGSGGFMSDLTFNGGGIGAFFGSQQFTTRNLTFNDCQTAIFMNWNWAWAFHDIKINNCAVGIDMANGGSTAQTVGSVLVLDSTISATEAAIKTAYDPASTQTNGTLVLDNVDLTNSAKGVVNDGGDVIVEGKQVVGFFAQGRAYGGSAGTSGKAVQAPQDAIKKPKVLLDSNGKVFTRSKPQYENYTIDHVVSVKDNGAAGDGVTDDTSAIISFLQELSYTNAIGFFPHGAYLVSRPIHVPVGVRIVGEAWSMILASGGSSWQDVNNPQPVFRIGQPGDKGRVEISDMLFGTNGPQPGAIMMEWNVEGSSPGDAGLWDVHTRIGGYAGSMQELDKCAKNPNVTTTMDNIDKWCYGSFMMLHVPAGGSVYLENTWYWVADHSLEPSAHDGQIDIFNARGVLIEGEGPVWGFGTASEHSVMYNYQFNKASNVYLALIQTETPYFQGNPDASQPFAVNTTYADPDFAKACADDKTGTCKRSWGVRAVDSKDIFIYGAGLYSFFDNYGQDCLKTESCQANMVSLEGSDGGKGSSQVHFYGLSTKASVNMLTVDGEGVVLDKDNRNNFCATLAYFQPA